MSGSYYPELRCLISLFKILSVRRACVAVRVRKARHSMSAETNNALVRRLLERVRGGWTSDVIEEFFAPSYRRYLNPRTPPLTREGQRDRANRLRAAFPDATATLEDILAEGDRVATVSPYAAPTEPSFKGFLPPASPSRSHSPQSFGSKMADWSKSGAVSISSICGNSLRLPPRQTWTASMARVRTPNSAFDRTAGSHALAATGQPRRWAC